MADLYDLRSGAATVVIDDGPYVGVEVVVQLDAPYRVRREAVRLYREFRDADADTDEEAAALDALYDLMARDVVLAWNLASGDEPVPVSLEGLHRASVALNLNVLNVWIQYAGKVMPPLPPSSPSTGEPEPSTASDSSDGDPSAASTTTPGTPSTP